MSIEREIAEIVKTRGWEAVPLALVEVANADEVVALIPQKSLVKGNPMLARVTEDAAISALRNTPKRNVATVFSKIPNNTPAKTQKLTIEACKLNIASFAYTRLRNRAFLDAVIRECPLLYGKMPLKALNFANARRWLESVKSRLAEYTTFSGVGQIQSGFSRIVRSMPVTLNFMRILIDNGAVMEPPSIINEIVLCDPNLPHDIQNRFTHKLSQAHLRRVFTNHRRRPIGRPPTVADFPDFPLTRQMIPTEVEFDALILELDESANALRRIGFLIEGYRDVWRLQTALGHVKNIYLPFFADRIDQIGAAADAAYVRAVPRPAPLVVDRDGFAADTSGPRGYKVEPIKTSLVESIAKSILEESDVKIASPKAPRPQVENGGALIVESETCFVCTCEIEGVAVVCACDERHYFCTHCFSFMVRVQCDVHHESFNLAEWESRGGRVKCPKAASVFPDNVVAIAAPDVIGFYIASLTEFARRQESLFAASEAQKATQRAIKKTVDAFVNPEKHEKLKREELVKASIKHIQDFILTHRCPSCQAPFSDYTHCSCVKCDCGVYFCALCRRFVSPDKTIAHCHVKDDCVYNPQRGTSYAFVDAQVLAQIAQADKNTLKEYMVRLDAPRDLKIEIIFGVSKDLIDNKISEAEIVDVIDAA